jgi:hypothetical protein
MFEGAQAPVGGGKVEPLVYRTDKFTPASFVSQAANRTSKDLAKVDLSPRIKNKVLLIPELAPIFREKVDELVNAFSIITRVLDGDGYTTDGLAERDRRPCVKRGTRWKRQIAVISGMTQSTGCPN